MKTSRVFAFDSRRVLVAREDAAVVLPTVEVVERHGVAVAWAHETVWDGDTVLIGEVTGLGEMTAAGDLPEPALPMELVSIRSLFGVLGDSQVLQVGRARQLLDWRLSHRLCGFCGASTEFQVGHGSLECPECARTYFPRLSPAVIVAVHRGDTLLLGRAPHRPAGWFSTLAGFVEPGESLEECVAREILEEVGIEVDEITYFGSQPWPFPDSLMVGFTARYVAGEIVPQAGEIEEADWFTLQDLPPVPPGYSIARELVDDFVRRVGGDPEQVVTWSV